MNGIELTPDEPVGAVVDRGVAAAEAGFDAVLVSAHYNNRDPFAVLARLAERTTDVRLGPGVVNPLETHPVALASRVATVAEQSDGRAVFGVGPGDPSTLGNLGLGRERGLEPVLDTVRVARALWDGERVTHRGSFVAEDAGLNFVPPGRIPVYVGGEGPDMCRMAAKHADGLLYNGAHPSDLAWARERVDEGLDRMAHHVDGDGSGAHGDRSKGTDGDRSSGTDGGRSSGTDGGRSSGTDGGRSSGTGAGRGNFDLVAYASVSIAADRSAAREAARRPVAFITAGAPEPVLDRHGVDRDRAAGIGDAIATGAFGEADDLVTNAMIDAFSAAGTPADVASRLDALLEHADGVVVGAPLGPDPDDAVSLAAAALDRARGS